MPITQAAPRPHPQPQPHPGIAHLEYVRGPRSHRRHSWQPALLSATRPYRVWGRRGPGRQRQAASGLGEGPGQSRAACPAQRGPWAQHLSPAISTRRPLPTAPTSTRLRILGPSHAPEALPTCSSLLRWDTSASEHPWASVYPSRLLTMAHKVLLSPCPHLLQLSPPRAPRLLAVPPMPQAWCCPRMFAHAVPSRWRALPHNTQLPRSPPSGLFCSQLRLLQQICTWHTLGI